MAIPYSAPHQTRLTIGAGGTGLRAGPDTNAPATAAQEPRTRTGRHPIGGVSPGRPDRAGSIPRGMTKGLTEASLGAAARVGRVPSPPMPRTRRAIGQGPRPSGTFQSEALEAGRFG